MLGYSPAALAGADVIRWGVGAVVCFPSTNARLLATVCRGGNAVVVVAVVVMVVVVMVAWLFVLWWS